MNSRINQNIKEKKGRNSEEASYKTLKHFLVYVEGTLYPWISLLEIGKDIMLTPQG